jgi:hypothetical protein
VQHDCQGDGEEGIKDLAAAALAHKESDEDRKRITAALSA